MPGQLTNGVSSRRVPQADKFAVAGRRQGLPIRGEGQSVDRLGVRGPVADVLAGGGVPYRNAADDGRGDRLAVESEGRTVRGASAQLEPFLPGCHIPELDLAG